jgi:very-short-patch-repair endonuclease
VGDRYEELARRLVDQAVDQFRDDLESELHDVGLLCQSPIESAMLVALRLDLGASSWGFYGLPVSAWATVYQRWPDAPTPFPGVYIFPQGQVGKYSADFLLCLNTSDGDTRWFAVECDGHDFHERTKAQARHDKSRDRWMMSADVTVLRFTGQEIYDDPERCASEVHNAMLKPLVRKNNG